MAKKIPIPAAVVKIGWVSFFTDVSTEMMYPLMPLFLTQTLKAGAAALGVIEGVAESTSAVLKMLSGIWTDRSRRRKPLIVLGYGLSTFLRPLVGLAQSWWGVLFFRFADRVGKGLRSSPRDALVADITTPANRGAAFGFHRAMDDAGALVGPLLSTLLLLVFAFSLRHIFLLSLIPGLAAWLILVFWIKDPGKGTFKPKPKFQAKDLSRDFKSLGPSFPSLMGALLLFTLGNSSDAFLLIRLSQTGLADWALPVLWSLHNGVRMVSTYYGGLWSDRVGRKPMMILGWFFYGLVYLGFAFAASPSAVIVLFLSYGLYYGFTEPSESALVADWVPARVRGTAYGYYYLTVGLGALPASLIFGGVAQHWGMPAAFLLGAALAAAAVVLLALVPPPGLSARVKA